MVMSGVLSWVLKEEVNTVLNRQDIVWILSGNICHLGLGVERNSLDNLLGTSGRPGLGVSLLVSSDHSVISLWDCCLL
jgi:hypothetical protein